MTHPAEFVPLREVPAGYPLRSCAYLSIGSALTIYDSHGRADLAPERPLAAGRHLLVALGLTEADLAELRRLEVAERCGYASRIAADRARMRAHELRSLRRGFAPLGSLCGSESETGVVIRLPDGSGWRGTSGLPRGPGWTWPAAGSRSPAGGREHLTHVMARELSDAQCRDVLAAVDRRYSAVLASGRGARSAREAAAAAAVRIDLRNGGWI